MAGTTARAHSQWIEVEGEASGAAGERRAPARGETGERTGAEGRRQEQGKRRRGQHEREHQKRARALERGDEGMKPAPQTLP